MSYVPPRAGQFRHIFSVERQGTVSDGVGGVTNEWEELLPMVYACVQETRGGEEVRGARLSGINRYDVVLRASAESLTITTDDRLMKDGIVHSIKWIGDIEGRGRFLNLICETGGLTDANQG